MKYDPKSTKHTNHTVKIVHEKLFFRYFCGDNFGHIMRLPYFFKKVKKKNPRQLVGMISHMKIYNYDPQTVATPLFEEPS